MIFVLYTKFRKEGSIWVAVIHFFADGTQTMDAILVKFHLLNKSINLTITEYMMQKP